MRLSFSKLFRRTPAPAPVSDPSEGSVVLASYPAAQSTPNRRTIQASVQSARLDISPFERLRMVAISRELERGDALVNRFLDLAEQYSVGPNGLRLRPASADAEWAKLARLEFEGWMPYADIASRQGWSQLESLILRLMLVDGEIFIFLTESEESGRPRVQLLETQCVATPPHLRAYEGRQIVEGVELDANGRPTAYWVALQSAPSPYVGFNQQWERVPAEQIIHVFEPSRPGQVRGLPIFYPVINDILDLQELQGLEMLAAKDAAETSKVINNETGEAHQETSGIGDSLRRRVAAAAAPETEEQRQAYYQQAIGGKTVVLKRGDDMKQFESQRPSVAVQQFWDYVGARAMAGAGLPIEIIIMKSLQGTMTRAALDMANAWFRSRSAALVGHLGRVYEHVIERSHAQGFLPSLPADWRKFRYTPPRSINVDVGRQSVALINEWKAGWRTLDEIANQLGYEWEEILEQKAREMAFAKELAARYGIDRAELIQMTPNETAATAAPASQPQPQDPAA